MAVHRSGLGRLRSNFTTVLDQQVASLSWLSRQAAGDPDLLEALVAELSRIQATALALELLDVARAADSAQRAATEGGLQDKIDALLEVCRSLDGSRPVFRPLVVMEPDEASAMRLRMRARSCAVQVDFYGESEELIRSARGDLPFAVVLPILLSKRWRPPSRRTTAWPQCPCTCSNLAERTWSAASRPSRPVPLDGSLPPSTSPRCSGASVSRSARPSPTSPACS